MNPTLLPARGPATRAAHALNDTMTEIAADVRVLRAQTNAPPPQTEAVVAENREPGTGGGTGMSVTEARLPLASETAVAPPSVDVTSGKPAAVVSPPASPRERVTLPPVVDVRPELAAFTATVNQQQVATVQTLRQVTLYCQQQQAQMERISKELERLDSRLRNLAQRP